MHFDFQLSHYSAAIRQTSYVVNTLSFNATIRWIPIEI